MKKLLLLILLFAVTFSVLAQKNHSINDIPDPKTQGQEYFVSNPDGILSDVDSLNRLIARLEKETKIEIAVVVVNDFDEQLDEFQFGLQLFRKWGIGKKEANNGLLLFASINRKKYRFITGYGLEGLLPDVNLKHISERNLIPAFKEQRYDEGIINSLNAISAFLRNPNNKAEVQLLIAETERQNNEWKDPAIYSVVIALLFTGFFMFMRSKTPKTDQKAFGKQLNGYEKVMGFGCGGILILMMITVFTSAFLFDFKNFGWVNLSNLPVILYVVLSLFLFFQYLGALSSLRKIHVDDQNFFESAKKLDQSLWWLFLGSPLILLGIIWNRTSRIKLTHRFTPILDKNNKAMVRIDRDINVEGKPFLTKGQRKEETLWVYDYDIWESEDHQEHKIKAWPTEKYNAYSECPECKFRTLSKPRIKTVKAATYSSQGTGKEIRECSNYKHEEFIKILYWTC